MTFLYSTLFFTCDAPRPWGMYFQDSASPQMEALAELHDNIMFYLFIILFAVGWIMVSIIRNYVNNKISHKYLNHGTLIELIWTITPALILILIAFPFYDLCITLLIVGVYALCVGVELSTRLAVHAEIPSSSQIPKQDVKPEPTFKGKEKEQGKQECNLMWALVPAGSQPDSIKSKQAGFFVFDKADNIGTNLMGLPVKNDIRQVGMLVNGTAHFGYYFSRVIFEDGFLMTMSFAVKYNRLLRLQASHNLLSGNTPLQVSNISGAAMLNKSSFDAHKISLEE